MKIKTMSARYAGTHQIETQATAQIVDTMSKTNPNPAQVALGRGQWPLAGTPDRR
jgi:hypothetical protein